MKENPLMTYLLEADTPTAITKVIGDLVKSGDCTWSKTKRKRGVVVSRRRPARYVREELAGNQYPVVSKTWLSHNILNELHAQYVANAPVRPSKAAAALRKWIAARENRAAAEQAHEDAKRAEWEASSDVVRTHGKAPVVIGGVMYDPGFKDDMVFLIPRRNHGSPKE